MRRGTPLATTARTRRRRRRRIQMLGGHGWRRRRRPTRQRRRRRRQGPGRGHRRRCNFRSQMTTKTPMTTRRRGTQAHRPRRPRVPLPRRWRAGSASVRMTRRGLWRRSNLVTCIFNLYVKFLAFVYLIFSKMFKFLQFVCSKYRFYMQMWISKSCVLQKSMHSRGNPP
jgi:hypothetical protein